MATINLGKVITDAQKGVLDRQSYDAENQVLNITGDESVAGNLTAKEILETSQPYISFEVGQNTENYTLEPIYAGICKNGNKLTIAIATNITVINAGTFAVPMATFILLSSIANRLYPTNIGGADVLQTSFIDAHSSAHERVSIPSWVDKKGQSTISIRFSTGGLTAGTKYYVRKEFTFLLSNNLVQ